jgi:hypothetical protein
MLSSCLQRCNVFAFMPKCRAVAVAVSPAASASRLNSTASFREPASIGLGETYLNLGLFDTDTISCRSTSESLFAGGRGWATLRIDRLRLPSLGSPHADTKVTAYARSLSALLHRFFDGSHHHSSLVFVVVAAPLCRPIAWSFFEQKQCICLDQCFVFAMQRSLEFGHTLLRQAEHMPHL